MEIIKIDCYKENLKVLLPETYKILKQSKLFVHPIVDKIILTGSRGLRYNYKRESDIDLSLIIERNIKDYELLKTIFNITMDNWCGNVELDIAILYDKNNCNFKCLNYEYFNESICKSDGMDCFGLFKLNKGFEGFVNDIGVNLKIASPFFTIWGK